MSFEGANRVRVSAIFRASGLGDYSSCRRGPRAHAKRIAGAMRRLIIPCNVLTAHGLGGFAYDIDLALPGYLSTGHILWGDVPLLTWLLDSKVEPTHVESLSKEGVSWCRWSQYR